MQSIHRSAYKQEVLGEDEMLVTVTLSLSQSYPAPMVRPLTIRPVPADTTWRVQLALGAGIRGDLAPCTGPRSVRASRASKGNSRLQKCGYSHERPGTGNRRRGKPDSAVTAALMEELVPAGSPPSWGRVRAPVPAPSPDPPPKASTSLSVNAGKQATG